MLRIRRGKTRTLEGTALASRYLTACVVSSALLMGCPGGQAHDDATQVARYVREKYPLPAKNEPALGPTIYFAPGLRSTTLSIYGVRDAPDQEKVVALVRQARSATSGRPVHIVFLDQERFVERGNSATRSGETVLRKVTVND